MNAPRRSAEGPKPPKKQGQIGLALGLALGVAAGVSIGVATDNMTMWIAIGLSLGLVFGLQYDQLRDKSTKRDGRVKIVDGATYTIVQRAAVRPGQRMHYWLGDDGTELELTDEEASQLGLD